MLLANIDGAHVPPPGPGVTAACPTCAAPVRAKAGPIVTWHWAHTSRADCDTWAEGVTAWHWGWQCTVPPERREVTIGAHRADIVTADGRVVEVQHSPISYMDVEAREACYGRDMIWIFDAAYAFKSGRLRLTRDESRSSCSFRWNQGRYAIEACTAQVYLDTGPTRRLLKLRHRYDDHGGFRGWGQLVDRDELIATFNRGALTSEPPAQPETALTLF